MAVNHALKRTGKFYDAGGADFNVLNPKYRGASSDDTDRFLNAVDDAMNEGGGCIVVPPRDTVFEVSEPIPFFSGLSMVGKTQRHCVIYCPDEDVDVIQIIGTAGWAPPIVQATLAHLKIQGPGVAGTGRGVYAQFGAAGINLKDLWIAAMASHGIAFDNTYSASLEDLLLDSNGGDGFHAETNANNLTFKRTMSLLNAGRGYAVIGGTTTQFLNADAEGNEGAGFDLRYVFSPQLIGCHMEGNGTDGSSPNVYLHWRTNAGEPCTAGFMRGCLLQGAGVTEDGLVIDGANGFDYADNWFNNHITDHVRLTANASRTIIGPNLFAGTGTELNDLSPSTQRLDRDNTNLLWRIKPGINFEAVAAPGLNPAGSLHRSTSFGGHLRYKPDDGIARTVLLGLENAATLDFPSVAANGGIQELNIAVSGAAVGDSVALYWPPTLNAGLIPTATVASAGNITVRLTNATTAAIDPGSGGYRVRVIKTQV